MKGLYLHISIFILVLLCFSCIKINTQKTNRGYDRQLDSLFKVLREVPSNSSIEPKPELIGTVNYNLRKPNFIILHHTAEENVQDAILKMTSPETQTSSHYVIQRNGKVIQMLSDYLRAWHAGVSRWSNITDMNSCSIGIELDNNGFDKFTEMQIKSLLNLLHKLKTAYNIPQNNILAHSDISYRKLDPNIYFPWEILAENGFGIWYEKDILDPTKGFDEKLHLKIIGYDVSEIDSAVVAFKRHYIRSNFDSRLTEKEKAILQSISNKVLENNY